MNTKLLFATLVASFVLIACNREIDDTVIVPVNNEEISEDVNLVPFTFVATIEDDTKAVLDADRKTTLWESTDAIAVFDNFSTTNHKFLVNGSGSKTTSFTGSLSSGAKSVVAVYPYSDDIVYNPSESNPITFRIPMIQEAVEESYDPNAVVFIATATSDEDPPSLGDAKLSFKSCFALLKVTVDVDDVTCIIAENTSFNLSGGSTFSTGGGVGVTGIPSANLFKGVVLKKSDCSALTKGKDYYIVIRHAGSSGVQNNFKLTYYTSTGESYSRTASSVETEKFKRKAVLNLGSLSDVTASGKSNYYYYMAGYTLKIGDEKSISLANNGAATLYTAANEESTLSSGNLTSGGVIFLNAVGTGSFSLASQPTIEANIYLLSHSDDAPFVFKEYENGGTKYAVITMNGKSLYMKGINISASVGNSQTYYIRPNTNTCPELVMDACAVDLNKAAFINISSSTTVGFTNIEMVNCKFIASGSGKNIVSVNSSSSGITQFEKMIFSNNYVYSNTGSNIGISVFAYSGSNAYSGMTVVLNNNLFYNTITGGSFKHNKVSSVTAKNNLLWTVNGTELSSNAKLIGMTTKEAIPSVTVTDNLAYGTLGASRSWTIADSKVNTGMEAISVEPSDPIASADVSTGTFTMASGYESYGPQAL